MDLYITQNSYYFVHRHFIKFFLNDNSHIIYVRERNRGLFKKYYEIAINLGILNTIYCSFCEFFYFIILYKKQLGLNAEFVNDINLNGLLEEKAQTGKYKRVFSIGCPCMIDSSLQEKYGINIYNLHGGIVPFQKGRFSPVKSLHKGHKYLGASLYLISNIFDEGSTISQDYFKVHKKYIIVNYNKVLVLSSDLLSSFFEGDLKKLPTKVFKNLNSNRS
tara:strand:+ start:996 stop:1652 length:657 start_codon:yes stop_codon:yes gene_type:complete